MVEVDKTDFELEYYRLLLEKYEQEMSLKIRSLKSKVQELENNNSWKLAGFPIIQIQKPMEWGDVH